MLSDTLTSGRVEGSAIESSSGHVSMGAVLQPFIDILVTPIQSATPRWVSNQRTHRPWLSPWGSQVALRAWSFQHRALKLAATLCQLVGCFGPPPIMRNISDPWGVLVPWASGPLVLSQTKDWSHELFPGLCLWTFPVPRGGGWLEVKLGFGVHPEWYFLSWLCHVGDILALLVSYKKAEVSGTMYMLYYRY